MAEDQDDPFAKYGGSEVKTTPQSGDPFAKYGGSEVKKNPSPAVSPNGGIQSNFGLNSSPNSPDATKPYAYITTTPEAQQKLISQDDQVRQQRQEQSDKIDKQLRPYYNSLTDDEKKSVNNLAMQSLASHYNDKLGVPTKQEMNDYNFSQTGLGKVMNGITYLSEKVAKGGVQTLKGAAYLADLVVNPQNAALGISNPNTDKAFDALDKGTDWLSKGDESRVEDSKAMANLGGFEQIVLPLMASEGTGGASMYLQGMGSAKENIDNIEKSGTKINPIVKNAYILGSGAVNGYLMGEAGSGIFKSLGTGLKNDVIAGITANAIKEAAGKDITGEGFYQLLKNGAKDWQDKTLQTGVNYLENTKHAILNLGAMNVGDFALKQGVDAVSDKPVFNENAGDLAEQLGNTIKTGAIFGAAGSFADMTKLFPGGQFKNTVVDNLMHDPSDENIAKTKQIITEQGQQQGWSPEEIQATTDHVDKIGAIVKQLPKGLPEDKITKAVDLVQGRNDLQRQQEQFIKDRSALTPPFNEQPGAAEQLVQDKIDQANDKLLDIANGTKTTYSKGIGDEEGKFFKTVGGKKEEITESRYKLERLERDANKQPNEQTEPNKEVSVEQPADEAGSAGEVTAPNDETTENNQIINQQDHEKEGSTKNGNGEETVNATNESSGAKSGEKTVATEEKVSEPVAGGDEPPVSDPKKQKAIDAVTHGIVVPEKIMGRDPSARFDFGMTTAEKQKAVQDIKNGKYETAPAKKMLAKLQEWEANDEYPIIEGLGGGSQRVKFASGKDIKENIDDAKANKIGELSQRQIDEFNGSAKDLGITAEDIKAHEDYEQSRYNPEARRSVSEAVQQPENDKGTGTAQGTSSETTQGSNEKGGINAIQEQSPGKVHVQSTPENSEKVGEGNTKPKEPATEGKESKPSEKAKALADKIRALKSDKNKAYGGLQGVGIAIYDGALETAATVIEQGGKLVDAIQAAVDHIRSKSDEKDEDKIRKAITKDLAEAGIAEEKSSITSARNEDTDKLREKLGLSPLMAIAARENPAVWDEVNRTLDENPNATDELISKLNQHMRPVTDLEQGLLIHKQIELETNIQKANDQIIENHENGTPDPWDKINLANARQHLTDLIDLQKRVGREWGLSGKFRQQLFKDDFSLANLERQTRGAVGGRELTQPELDEIQKVHDEFAKKVKEYEATIKNLKDKNAKLEQQQAEKKLKEHADFEARKAKREGKVLDYDKNIKDNIAKAREKLAKLAKTNQSAVIPYARELFEIAPELGEIAKSYIGKGITKLEDIVDNIHNELEKDLPGLTKRAVMDALSGYGKDPKASEVSDMQKQLAELKLQAKLISRLEDLKNGIKDTDQPKVKQAKNEEITKLQQQIHELTKGETVNKAYITRMRNMTKDLQNRLSKSDFIKKVKLPVELTPEAREARAGYLRVKRDFDRALERKRLAERPSLFKLADWGVKWRRFVLFANPTTWLKLGSYATMEVLSKPLHEITGSVIRQLPYFSKVAALAPREGHTFNPTVEAKAFAQLWAKGTWSDIIKNIGNKEGALKAAHSDNLDSTPDQPWLDIMQNWHSAIKEIPLHAEVERSIYLRTMHAMANDIDVSQPLVQMKIIAESVKDNLPGDKIKEIEDKAYQDGLRSILMQDNLVSNSWAKVTQWLDQVSETGKIGKNIDATERFKAGAKGLSTMLKVIIPITKVPVNYVIGRLEYTPVLGAAKALLVMRRGLENMSPDDADYVMRIMKKQGVSAGLLALGYLNHKNFGGFQVSADKRRAGQIKANEIKLFGVTLPKFMTHTPFLTVLTLGATIRHIHDNYVEGTMTDSHIKQAKKENWYSDAPLAMMRDINKQIPFTETESETSDALRSKQAWNKWAADFIEGLVLPPDVKSLAREQDLQKSGEHKGEPIKRDIKTFGDELKSNIPFGPRKTIPRKVNQ